MTNNNSKSNLVIALGVSLGGFLFGFDAAVISGVTGYIVPEFSLNDLQLGWVVASLTLASALAMLTVGPISDWAGRKSLLQVTGLLYAISAILSAIAPSYTLLVLARMVGGLAVGSALILAPMYIAETSAPRNRGRMVSIQQLNIVLGFSAAYFSNYYLLSLSQSSVDFALEMNLESEVWRWMLGVEALPAILFFIAMMFVPPSPRWLMLKNRPDQARKILEKIHPVEIAKVEFEKISNSMGAPERKLPLAELFAPSLRKVLFIGILIAVLQQITGVNAIYFYATSIFEQSGVGKDAAFAQAVWVGIINVVFTLVAMYVIDKFGRRPLLLIGVIGVAASMMLTSYGFHNATYSLSQETLSSIPELIVSDELVNMTQNTYSSDVEFKRDLRMNMGEELYTIHQAEIIKDSIKMNPILILVGILGFVASFALSLGPVMWVLLSELFPNWIRGLAISAVGFINSTISFLVQLAFPWELSNLGNSLSYLIYAIFAIIGFILLYKYLPETKGKSLEEIESELVG
ncbi:MAG: sugar porter family MFS transporter [Bacteroidia bacterium]|nr:sugar porter family MFS transporter [Bacteroidia bacterium]